MYRDSIWIYGATRSGKTHRLIQQLCTWAETPTIRSPARPFSTFLVFAATGDNRLELDDRIAAVTQGQYRVDSATPLGFFQDEVTLFLPLIVETLQLKTQFPIRLRPETEQQLATQLWQPALDAGRLQQPGVQEYFVVRRTLDLLQLAATAGIPHEDIPLILAQGFGQLEDAPELWEAMGEALAQWWHWCMERGIFTYGIITELYWRYLLPHSTYQHHLKRRYHAVLADDVDEYPAVMRSLFQVFLDHEIPILFTFNPVGGVRVGLGADPDALNSLADRCQQGETLTQNPDGLPPTGGHRSVGATWGSTVVEWLQQPMILPQLPASIQTLQTTSRAELLRQTAERIVDAVQSGQVQPQEIAVIAPGLDAIARYTLREILTRRDIPVLSLNDQHPLASSPLIRALLTLLALIYPGLGRLLSRETVAEMLVLLSQTPGVQGAIDPVRAGLLTDHCFVPDPNQPHLLPATTFPRWDRLGHQSTQAYENLRAWIADQKDQQQQRLIPTPVVLLDRAIQRFLYGGSHLPYDQLAALRELMETAQHYWEVDARLRQHSRSDGLAAPTVEQFIRLLREGTITADPYPVRPMGKTSQAVTLATIYQYRSDRRFHRWQFWLDAGSPYWLTGGAVLFGAPLFLQQWHGRPWTAADTLEADQRRLERQVLDLLYRAEERVYLCYSELATNGQEQTGSLLSLVNAALPLTVSASSSP
ncbi:recombinase family protein [Egbenema bharatensis]|uniref:recombinase family protein n=1 Tax=Egbenema bharatensis TaxID=3463334 RepID=UPI003A849124